LIWAGVAVYREQEGGPVVGLRGDRDATKLLYGQLTARYIDARVKQFDGYSFKLAKSGREKRVMREDLIPRSKRKIAVAHFEYVHYGQLFWILEVYLTSEELIQTGYYQQDDPNLPTPGDYVHVLHLRGHDGLYREPDREWLQWWAGRHYEAMNTPLKELYAKDRAASDERRQVEEEAEAKQTCADPEDLLRLTIDEPSLSKNPYLTR
jgi:hypothetical protein